MRRYAKRLGTRSSKKGIRRKRGFYASANLGPFGKYSVGFKRGVSNVVHSLEVPQHYNQSDGINFITNMTQGTIYTYPLTANIVQGVTNINRLGDEIHLESLKVNHAFTTAAGTHNDNETHCRIMLVKHTKQLTGTIWTTGLGLTDLFFSSGGSAATTDAIVDPKRVTVLYDVTCKLTPRIVAQQCFQQCRITIPLKQKFVYQTGTAFGKMNNLYLVAVAFQPGGTPGTTNVAGMLTNTDLIFKNVK